MPECSRPRLDDQGRITAFTLWPVQCGPPPPKDNNGNDTAAATLKPLPGIELKPGDAVCSTSSVSAPCRNAAKASARPGRRSPRGGDH